MSINPKLIFSAVKKYAPTILSGMAVVGVGLTGWLTYRAVIKTYTQSEDFVPNDIPEDRREEITKEFQEGRERGVRAVTNYTSRKHWKNYIPPAIAAAGTIACIIGANSMHLKREAMALAAVAFYKAAGEDFEEAVFDKFGDAGLKENVMNADVKHDVPRSMNTEIRIWEPYTCQWFEATQQEILWAEITANKMLHQRGYVTLNDVLKLYSDPKLKMKSKGNKLGWSWGDETFEESACYYYAGGWIDMCPQFEEHNGTMRFVMDYGINPNDISDKLVYERYPD